MQCFASQRCALSSANTHSSLLPLSSQWWLRRALWIVRISWASSVSNLAGRRWNKQWAGAVCLLPNQTFKPASRRDQGLHYSIPRDPLQTTEDLVRLRFEVNFLVPLPALHSLDATPLVLAFGSGFPLCLSLRFQSVLCRVSRKACCNSCSTLSSLTRLSLPCVEECQRYDCSLCTGHGDKN